MNRTYLNIVLLLLLVINLGCKNDSQTKSENQPNEIDQPQEDPELSSGEQSGERLLNDLIQVETPQAGDTIETQQHIKGKARGMWFFEGDFPIYLVNEEGEELAVAIAVGEGDWMTTEWVGFTATLDYESDESGEGWLIFKKDNPSDKRELDRDLRIPVSF